MVNGVFAKTKNGGTERYFTITSYNTHPEIRQILSTA